MFSAVPTGLAFSAMRGRSPLVAFLLLLFHRTAAAEAKLATPATTPTTTPAMAPLDKPDLCGVEIAEADAVADDAAIVLPVPTAVEDAVWDVVDVV